MVTYAKSSPKMVHPRDIARNAEEEEEYVREVIAEKSHKYYEYG